MLKMLRSLFPTTPRKRHQQELSAKTHEAKNDTQRMLLEYQHRSRRQRAKLIKELDKSAQELSSVAERIAVATGSRRRH